MQNIKNIETKLINLKEKLSFETLIINAPNFAKNIQKFKIVMTHTYLIFSVYFIVDMALNSYLLMNIRNDKKKTYPNEILDSNSKQIQNDLNFYKEALNIADRFEDNETIQITSILISFYLISDFCIAFFRAAEKKVMIVFLCGLILDLCFIQTFLNKSDNSFSSLFTNKQNNKKEFIIFLENSLLSIFVVFRIFRIFSIAKKFYKLNKIPQNQRKTLKQLLQDAEVDFQQLLNQLQLQKKETLLVQEKENTKKSSRIVQKHQNSNTVDKVQNSTIQTQQDYYLNSLQTQESQNSMQETRSVSSVPNGKFSKKSKIKNNDQNSAKKKQKLQQLDQELNLKYAEGGKGILPKQNQYKQNKESLNLETQQNQLQKHKNSFSKIVENQHKESCDSIIDQTEKKEKKEVSQDDIKRVNPKIESLKNNNSNNEKETYLNRRNNGNANKLPHKKETQNQSQPQKQIYKTDSERTNYTPAKKSNQNIIQINNQYRSHEKLKENDFIKKEKQKYIKQKNQLDVKTIYQRKSQKQKNENIVETQYVPRIPSRETASTETSSNSNRREQIQKQNNVQKNDPNFKQNNDLSQENEKPEHKTQKTEIYYDKEIKNDDEQSSYSTGITKENLEDSESTHQLNIEAEDKSNMSQKIQTDIYSEDTSIFHSNHSQDPNFEQHYITSPIEQSSTSNQACQVDFDSVSNNFGHVSETNEMINEQNEEVILESSINKEEQDQNQNEQKDDNAFYFDFHFDKGKFQVRVPDLYNFDYYFDQQCAERGVDYFTILLAKIYLNKQFLDQCQERSEWSQYLNKKLENYLKFYRQLKERYNLTRV